MNTLKYKGYIGSVAYSEPDKVFFGKIEGIDGLVNYEGESVQELTAAFQEAVEDYLVFCEENGIAPEKSYTGTFNIRIAPDVHRAIANLAAEAGISINAFVKRVLGEAVNRQRHNAIIPEPATLMEPKTQYGSQDQIKLSVPHKDRALAEELTRRMGWKVE